MNYSPKPNNYVNDPKGKPDVLRFGLQFKEDLRNTMVKLGIKNATGFIRTLAEERLSEILEE